MVEPLSIVATCLSLADFAVSLADRISTLLKKVENADLSIRTLVNEIQQLSGILKNLGSKFPNSIVDSLPLPDLSLITLENQEWASVQQIMSHCQESLDGLEEVVDKINPKDAKFMRKAIIIKRFEQHKVILAIRKDEISRYRQALDIALGSTVV